MTDKQAKQKLCSDCRWCGQGDYGYSNWTVEGTTLFCVRGLNPADAQLIEQCRHGLERLGVLSHEMRLEGNGQTADVMDGMLGPLRELYKRAASPAPGREGVVGECPNSLSGLHGYSRAGVCWSCGAQRAPGEPPASPAPETAEVYPAMPIRADYRECIPWIAIIENEHTASDTQLLNGHPRCAACRWSWPCPSLRLAQLVRVGAAAPAAGTRAEGMEEAARMVEKEGRAYYDRSRVFSEELMRLAAAIRAAAKEGA